jgi:dolichol-phosphate mannosyltransferase
MTGTENYVVIPTYKECENLKILLPQLSKLKLIIVDDNSNDGTEELCGRFKNVRLIVRRDKRGLSSAVLDGIKSIRSKNAKVVVTDADFEHDHSRIPEIFRLLDKSDFVECVKVGKRSAHRALVSKVGSTIAYSAVPQLKALKDPMSGFFGFKVAKVDLGRIKPRGYKIMLDIFLSFKKKPRIERLFYKYGEREHGKSKLTLTVILNFLSQIMSLNSYRFPIFLVIGVFGIAVNEGLLFVFYRVTSLISALALAIIISAFINFVLNHYITFGARAPFFPSAGKFGVVAVAGLSINFILALFLSYFMSYLAANFIGILAAFVFKYVLSEGYVWKVIW